MNQPIDTESTNALWLARSEMVMRKAGLENFTDLAKALGMTKSAMHQFKRGETELSPLTRLIILEKLDVPWARLAIEELTPKKQLDQLRRSSEFWKENSNEAAKEFETPSFDSLHGSGIGNTATQRPTIDAITADLISLLSQRLKASKSFDQVS